MGDMIATRDSYGNELVALGKEFENLVTKERLEELKMATPNTNE